MNIVEILKDVPKGTKFYSTTFGDVELLEINNESNHPIKVKICSNDRVAAFSKEGKVGTVYPNSECVLFPSNENRDWNIFKVEKSYEGKPFDRVLVRNEDNEPWVIQFFGYYDEFAKDEAPYVCLGNSVCIADTFKQCIPFEGNEKLLGRYDNV